MKKKVQPKIQDLKFTPISKSDKKKIKGGGSDTIIITDVLAF